MDNLAVVVAAPREVILAGLPYKVGPLRLAELGVLQQWIAAQVPHPIAALRPHLEGLPESVQLQLLENARRDARDWPPKVGSEAAGQILMTPEGERELLFVLLAKYQPAITRDHVAALLDRISAAELAELIGIAFGRDIEAGDDAGPKTKAAAARNGASSPSGSRTASAGRRPRSPS